MTGTKCQGYGICFSFYDSEFVPSDDVDQRMATGE